MGVRRTVAGALGAALLVPVSACSNDGPAPPPLASPTTTAPSASPTESSPSPSGPPTLPPEAQGTSKAAAIAFVRHWVEVFNYASATGDVAPLMRLHAPSCTVCDVVTGRLDEIYSSGGSLRSEGWSVLETNYLSLQPRLKPVVDTAIRVSPEVAVEQRGAKPERFRGGRVVYTFRLDWDDAWRVRGLEQAS